MGYPSQVAYSSRLALLFLRSLRWLRRYAHYEMRCSTELTAPARVTNNREGNYSLVQYREVGATISDPLNGDFLLQIFYYYFYGDFLFYVSTLAVPIWQEPEHISATPPAYLFPPSTPLPPTYLYQPPTQRYRACRT